MILSLPLWIVFLILVRPGASSWRASWSDDAENESQPEVITSKWTDRDRPPKITDTQNESKSSKESASQSPRGKQQFDGSEFEFDWQSQTAITFNDVGGMSELIEELKNEIIRPLTEDKELADALGVSAGNILFYGPPGTGKSHLAKAIAGELNRPHCFITGPDIQSKYINESAEKVGQLFDEAKEIASDYDGAMIFIDEIDSLLSDRDSPSQHKEDVKTLNEFLQAIESANDHENDVIVIGATNRLEILDQASIRKGRIDKKILIGKPDLQAREAILRTQLSDRPNVINEQTISKVASHTEGCVAADLAGIVETAATQAFAHSEPEITDERLLQAVKREFASK